MCSEDQPAASQTSWRATPDIRALEAVINIIIIIIIKVWQTFKLINFLNNIAGQLWLI